MIGGAVKGFLSGVKWQILLWKVAVYVVIVAGVATVAYREGKSGCEIAALEKQTKENAALVVQERENVREALAEMHASMSARLAVVDKQSREAEQLRSDMSKIGDVIYEEHGKRVGGDCVPTANELRAWDALAERTRHGGRD